VTGERTGGRRAWRGAEGGIVWGTVGGHSEGGRVWLQGEGEREGEGER
jgi:hypothetical protein